MFVGHFAVAALVKAKEPKVPLWSLMVSTHLLDLLFAPLYIAGIETIEPGTAGYGEAIIHANYTHSLVGALLIAMVASGLAWRAWGKRSGLVIFGVVCSHWLLDLLVHRVDLPILPGNLGHLPMLGLGLWRFPLASASLELLLILVGAVMYFRSALSRSRASGQGNRPALTAGLVMGTLLAAAFFVDVVGIG